MPGFTVACHLRCSGSSQSATPVLLSMGASTISLGWFGFGPRGDDDDKRFVACYRDPEGRQRSAGTYSSRRVANAPPHREEAKVREGAWHDHSCGQVTFAQHVATVWPPAEHVATSTLAAYRSFASTGFHGARR